MPRDLKLVCGAAQTAARQREEERKRTAKRQFDLQVQTFIHLIVPCFGQATCEPRYASMWEAHHRGFGHWTIASLLAHELLGGEIVLWTVPEVGPWYANRFGGEVVDMTGLSIALNPKSFKPVDAEQLRATVNPEHFRQIRDLFFFRAFHALATW